MAIQKCSECGGQVSDKAEKCPACGAPAKKKAGILKMAALGFGSLVLIGMCSAALSKKSGQETTSGVAVADTGVTKPDDGHPAKPVAKSNLGDSLEFGKPTLKAMGVGNMAQVLVETKNTGAVGITCTVTATFKKGDQILGAANGAVNDVPAGGVKTAQLMTTDSVDGFDVVKLETSACFPSMASATSAGAGARSGDPLTFGKPTVKSMGGGMNQVLVEATNSTNKEITCTLTATFKKSGEILNTANGAINEVQAGGTKTAQLMTTGAIAGYDELILEASACF